MLHKLLALAYLLFASVPARAGSSGWGCVSSSYCEEADLNDIIQEALISYGNPAFMHGDRIAVARLETLALRLDKAVARISLSGESLPSPASLILEYAAASQPGVSVDGVEMSLRNLVAPLYIGVTGGAVIDDGLTARLARRLQRTFERAASRVLGRTPSAEQLMPVVSRLFSGKTLVGDDGTRQEFGVLDRATGTIEVRLTLPDGRVFDIVDKVVDTRFARAALLVESVVGGGSPSADLSVAADGSYVARPIHPEDTGFVSRVCRTTAAGRTECILTVTNDGSARPIVFRERP